MAMVMRYPCNSHVYVLLVMWDEFCILLKLVKMLAWQQPYSVHLLTSLERSSFFLSSFWLNISYFLCVLHYLQYVSLISTVYFAVVLHLFALSLIRKILSNSLVSTWLTQVHSNVWSSPSHFSDCFYFYSLNAVAVAVCFRIFSRSVLDSFVVSK